MHERKATMADLADAFMLLPGGFGSWEEFCEVVTWAHLGLHTKPCGLLNVSGYYSPFLALAGAPSRKDLCAPAINRRSRSTTIRIGCLINWRVWRP